MLRKFAAIAQVERAVGYEHHERGKRTEKERWDQRYVDLYEAKVLHFRRYARLKIRIVNPSYVSTRVSSARVRVTADASDFLRKCVTVYVHERRLTIVSFSSSALIYYSILVLKFRLPFAFDSLSNAFSFSIHSVHDSKFNLISDVTVLERYISFILRNRRWMILIYFWKWISITRCLFRKINEMYLYFCE